MPAIVRDGDDVLIVTWANGLFLARERPNGWPADGHRRAGSSTCGGWRRCRSTRSSATPSPSGASLVVDETRRSGGVGEAVVAALVEAGFTGPVRRVAGADSFIPLGDAARLVLVSEDDIESAARALCATG